MDKKQQKELLQLARGTVVASVTGEGMPQPEQLHEPFLANSGCFVTIKRNGQLRGCIGCFVADKPLWQTVQEMAVSASQNDPRFHPMTKGELTDFTLEISVLSPLQLIDSVEQIQVGRDGIYIIKGAARGVLLPQVATEYGWDRITFLQQTCRKAGLPEDAWQSGANIYTFSAEIFGE